MFIKEIELDDFVEKKLYSKNEDYGYVKQVSQAEQLINFGSLSKEFYDCLKSVGGKTNDIDVNDFNTKGGKGMPVVDNVVIQYKKNKRTIIIVENKIGTKHHQSNEDFKLCNQAKDYAVDGVLWYAKALSKKFNVIALAISANTRDDYLVSGYRINKSSTQIVEIFKKYNTLQSAKDYFGLNEYNHEINELNKLNDSEFIKRIDEIGKELSGQLDAVMEAADRPGFMSVIMLGLFNKKGETGKRFISLINDDESTKEALLKELDDIIDTRLNFMPKEKREFALGIVKSAKNNKNCTDDFLKSFSKRLHEEVIPLFDQERKFDIIGKFYQIFLKYTNQGDKKNGIVLTPHHITNLFTDLVKFKSDASDTIFDPCCGSGAFLISGMNKLLEINKTHNLNKEENIKNKQIVGNELMPKIYGLCVANMLFHGDGKSNILNEDFFSEEFDTLFNKLKLDTRRHEPTIGFVNPPYSGNAKDKEDLEKIKAGKKKSTKEAKIREIEFFRKMLSLTSRYGVMIAPLSVFSGDSDADCREEILKMGKLKLMIKMPDEIFSETINVGTQTYICVIDKQNGKHEYDKDWVVMYDCSDDGFNKLKNKRIDPKNNWEKIKKIMLDTIDAPNYENWEFESKEAMNKHHFIEDKEKEYKILKGSKGLIAKIKPNDEWVLEAWMPTDYAKLTESNFEQTIIDYLKFELLNEKEENNE